MEHELVTNGTFSRSEQAAVYSSGWSNAEW